MLRAPRLAGVRPMGLARAMPLRPCQPLRSRLLPLRASNGNGDGGITSDDEGTYNVAGEYCAIDSKGKKMAKRTLGEMEQDFLAAMASW